MLRASFSDRPLPSTSTHRFCWRSSHLNGLVTRARSVIVDLFLTSTFQVFRQALEQLHDLQTLQIYGVLDKPPGDKDGAFVTGPDGAPNLALVGSHGGIREVESSDRIDSVGDGGGGGSSGYDGGAGKQQGKAETYAAQDDAWFGKGKAKPPSTPKYSTSTVGVSGGGGGGGSGDFSPRDDIDRALLPPIPAEKPDDPLSTPVTKPPPKPNTPPGMVVGTSEGDVTSDMKTWATLLYFATTGRELIALDHGTWVIPALPKSECACSFESLTQELFKHRTTH